MLDDVPMTVVKGFAIAGALLVIPVVYRLLSFIWIYFIRPSSIRNYLTDTAPYALVTGASDGIGKGVAKELYRRGFNLILHGRNEEKTRKVAEEIKASGGGRDVRFFLADVTSSGHDFKKMVEGFKDLNITLLFNNVGGTTVKPANNGEWTRIDEWTEDELVGTVRWNALFSLQLIHALLPQLRASPGPVLVMNVGSQAGDHPLPRLAVYAASKRFMDILSRGLSMDERYYTPTNVGFMYLSVGQVATKLGIPPSFWGPDADTFAKAVVDRVGCGRVRIAPYVGHAITEWSSDILPGRLEEIVLARFMKQFMKQMFLGQDKKVE